MPFKYARHLTSHHRTTGANRHLGIALAFIAGAINAGGFLAVKQYTSHMTGIVSTIADQIILGDFGLLLNAFGGLIAFLLGAATSAVLVNYGRRRFLHSQFALPLLLEALLLLFFGFMGARLSTINGLFVPLTVVLLCFIMGLQNAVISKISKSEIRTTHLTGMITDIGIELGKLFYWNRLQTNKDLYVSANRERLLILFLLVSAFFVGGVVGAYGFHHFGYAMTIPLAIVLVALASVPAVDDMRHLFNKS